MFSALVTRLPGVTGRGIGGHFVNAPFQASRAAAHPSLGMRWEHDSENHLVFRWSRDHFVHAGQN
jgi:hypothetical protein